MEAKKTVRIVIFLILAAVAIFGLILFFNNHLESKGEIIQPAAETADTDGNRQSYAAASMPAFDEDDFSSGSSGGLTIFVYEDYSDIFSADFAASLEKARLDFGDQLKIVYRPFNVGRTNLSLEAAVAVRCAADQGKGEAFRNRVFQAVRANQLNSDKISNLAVETELNGDDFKACLTNLEKKERIERLLDEASDFSVYGAPTVFVGDEMIVGARPYDSFTDSNGDEIEGLKQVIENKLK